MAKAELWVHYKPSLFQHIGTHSSLKGKVQKLKVHILKGKQLHIWYFCFFFFFLYSIVITNGMFRINNLEK